MTIFSVIKKLCENRNETIAGLERKTGISNGTIRRWDKISPSVEKVQTVADFFNVSVDYLLGRSSTPFINSDEDSSHISLLKKGIRKELLPEQEEKVYKLLEVAMPELIEDSEYIEMKIAARGGSRIKSHKITKVQAAQAQKLVDKTPSSDVP